MPYKKNGHSPESVEEGQFGFPYKFVQIPNILTQCVARRKFMDYILNKITLNQCSYEEELELVSEAIFMMVGKMQLREKCMMR